MSATISSYKLIDNLRIEETDFEVSNKKFLVLCGKKQFYCGFLIKEVLQAIDNYSSVEKIHFHITQFPAYQKLTPQDVEKIIETKIKPLGVLDSDDDIKQKISYDTDSIKTQKTLLNEEKTYFLASIFKYFYKRWAVVVLILMGVFAHLFYFSSHSLMEEKSKVWIEASAIEYILIYFLVIVIFIFHEIGHASAALHFGIRTPRVGYGFYLVYPVFFTEISEAWKLQPKKRMIINFGGIYFQWIAGSIFIFLDHISLFSLKIWSGIVVINFVRLLYSFVPFMKADGYWIFSDGFGLTNLRKKSNQFLAAIFKSFSFTKAKEITETKRQHYALTFFSFGTILFFSFWFTVLGLLILKLTPMLPTVVVSFYEKFRTSTDISQYLKVSLQSVLLCITLLGVSIFIIRMVGLIRFAVHFLLKKDNKNQI
ncbi:hypothetical protein [Bernardetia sp.]|uniref:hypothetical protein n=1 Tax=Bernardetia sp. TaxID=1937974 RepID=UPI0025BF0ABB|nr:hypothetical protein [Bernardetia sp.]